MKIIIKLAAYLSLICMLVYGLRSQENKTFQYLIDNFNGQTIERTSSHPETYKVMDGDNPIYYIYPGHVTGWGGPMTVAPVVTSTGVIKEVLIPEHRETPVFIDYILSSGFLSQFKGKLPDSPMEFGEDIDGVSGATVSSAAISEGVRQGMAMASQELLKKPLVNPARPWEVGRDEVLLLILYTVVLVCVYFKIRKARLPVLIFAFIFLGLMVNRPVSISNIAALLMGHVPDIRSNLFWWMLVPGSMSMVIVFRKNLYCSWLCPFGAIQELISKTGGMNIFVSKRIQKWLKTTAKAMAWLLLIFAFYTGNAANATVEPFATLFGLMGNSFQWYLVSITIGGSFLIPRFWCRFFCPAGVCYNKMAGVRRVVTKGISIKSSMKTENHETVTN